MAGTARPPNLTDHAAGKVADASSLQPGAAALLEHGHAPVGVALGQLEDGLVLGWVVVEEPPGGAEGRGQGTCPSSC